MLYQSLRHLLQAQGLLAVCVWVSAPGVIALPFCVYGFSVLTPVELILDSGPGNKNGLLLPNSTTDQGNCSSPSQLWATLQWLT